MFYSSVICSVLTFGLTSWGGNITKCSEDRLNKIIKKAGQVIGRKQENLGQLFDNRTKKKTENILKDVTHPLYLDFDVLKITKSGRFRLPKARTNRYLDSFLPSAIRIFNKNRGRTAL